MGFLMDTVNDINIDTNINIRKSKEKIINISNNTVLIIKNVC